MDRVARRLLSTVFAGALLAACSPFGEAPAGAGPDDGGGDGGAADAALADSPANDGPVVCVDACKNDAIRCKSFDFEGTACPPELTPGGDPGNVSCDSGSLHISAANTLDATATIGVQTPSQPFSARVSVRATIKTWRSAGGDPSRRLLEVSIGGARLVQLRAAMNKDGTIALVACGAVTIASTCNLVSRSLEVDRPYRLAFALPSTGSFETHVDCEVVGTHSGTPLPQNKPLDVLFGDNDGSPIDGRFDDLLIELDPAR